MVNNPEAFIQSETPRSGRFALLRLNYFIAFFLLFLAWMQPLHLPPWVSWHSELLAFSGVLWLFLASLTSRAKRRNGDFALPNACRLIVLLVLVVLIQVATGQIQFFGDALVLVFYLSLCFLAVSIGFEWAVWDTGLSALVPDSVWIFTRDIALLLVSVGFLSVVVALVQTFEVGDSANWINRMPTLRRPGANIGQPNQLATLLLFSVGSLIYLYESEKVHGLTAFLVSLVLLFGLAITESRTGLLSLVVLISWWFGKRGKVGFLLTPEKLGIPVIFYVCCFWFWPSIYAYIQAGGVSEHVGAQWVQVNTSAGTRLTVWPQLLEAVWRHPWFGWGLREVSEAQNLVLDAYSFSEPFTYAHNLFLEMAVGMGIPLTALVSFALFAWLWRCIRETKELLTWYCLALLLPFGVHCLLEFPYAYAYLLAPVMLAIGVLEGRLMPRNNFRIGWWPAAIGLLVLISAMAWSVVEYFSLEEDFRVARFEALRIGVTPSEYAKPKVILLTQLDALAVGARIVPAAGMSFDRVELMRRVAMRFPWPALQNRYALALALNGNPEEAIRQLKVIRAMHGQKAYLDIKAQWETLAREKHPQLAQLKLP